MFRPLGWTLEVTVDLIIKAGYDRPTFAYDYRSARGQLS